MRADKSKPNTRIVSAFHLLKVSPESSRAEIDSAYEDASFDERESENVLRKAVDTLTTPRLRLREELSYFWGVPLPKIDELIHSTETTDTGLLSKAMENMPLPALTKANLATYFCGFGNTRNADNFKDSLNCLIAAQKHIDVNDVSALINNARKKSGVVPVAKLEHIADALAKLRDEKHMESAGDAIFYAAHPGILMAEIAENWRHDKTANGRFVADLVRGVYKNRIQEILRPLEEEIDRAADVLWHSPRDEEQLCLIESKLSEWDEYAQPIQLIDEGKGFDEKSSSEICKKLRDLSLHINNNENEPEISLRITRLLNKVFPELPEAAEYLAQDLQALEKIVGEKHQDNKIKERLQTFQNAVRDVQNDSGKVPDLLDAFQALLRECPELAPDKNMWMHVRGIAIMLHNRYNATSLALLLVKRLSVMAISASAPQSVYDQLCEDINLLEKIAPQKRKKTVSDSKMAAKKSEKRSKSKYFWIIILIITSIFFYDIHFRSSSKTDSSGNTSRYTGSNSAGKTTSENRRLVYVTASNLNVRKSRSGNSKIIGVLPRYQNVSAIGSSRNGWQKIVYGSQTGYVSAQYIKNGDGKQAQRDRGMLKLDARTESLIEDYSERFSTRETPLSPSGFRPLLEALAPEKRTEVLTWMVDRLHEGKAKEAGIERSTYLSFYGLNGSAGAPEQSPEQEARPHGDGKQAQRDICRESITRPKSGALLYTAWRTGTNSISVHNGGGSDIIVKLRDQFDSTVVAFYLRQNESYTYDKVPTGSFLFTYASGKNYSTECGVFMNNMIAHRSPDEDNYSSGEGWIYRLKPVTDGNFRPQNMNVENF